MANGKITVKANEEFFDGANQILRREGSEFVLKAEYAKTLGKAVSEVDNKDRPKTTKAQQKEVNSRKATEYNTTLRERNQRAGRKVTEAVEKATTTQTTEKKDIKAGTIKRSGGPGK